MQLRSIVGLSLDIYLEETVPETSVAQERFLIKRTSHLDSSEQHAIRFRFGVGDKL